MLITIDGRTFATVDEVNDYHLNLHRIRNAAPDLLEALERTLNWLASYPGKGALVPGGPYEQALAAIAKARGQKPV